MTVDDVEEEEERGDPLQATFTEGGVERQQTLDETADERGES